MADIHIFDTPDDLYSTAAALFLKAGSVSLQEKDSFTVALAGGSTPLPLYQMLAADQDADPLAWDKTHFFWGDERPVGPDHQDSNFRAGYQALLAPRGVPEGNIHRVQGELGGV